VVALNAGISGSDVLYSYMLLKKQLAAFAPNIVIVVVNNSDVNDVILRGGMERFNPDGKLNAKRAAPKWEWLYGLSYIFRHIIHDLLKYDRLFIKQSETASEERKAVGEIKRAMSHFCRLANEGDFRLLFVFHPMEIEIRNERYYPTAFDELIQELKSTTNAHVVDLLEHYRLTGSITKNNSHTYFWPIDLHHNAKGYELMGDAIARKMIDIGLIDGKHRESC
jgi:hypothetical protein